MVPRASQDPASPRRTTITLPHHNPQSQSRPPEKAVKPFWQHLAYEAALTPFPTDNPRTDDDWEQWHLEVIYSAGDITTGEYLAQSHSHFARHIDATLVALVASTLTADEAHELVLRRDVAVVEERRAA